VYCSKQVIGNESLSSVVRESLEVHGRNIFNEVYIDDKQCSQKQNYTVNTLHRALVEDADKEQLLE